MRPARKGPENPLIFDAVESWTYEASMRPARKGPENPTAKLDKWSPVDELQ